MKTNCWLAIGVQLAILAVARAEAPKGEFQVHDLSIWIVDNSAPLANARGSYASPFPPTVNSARAERSNVAERRAAPLGLLSFFGRPAENLDVDLRMKSGSFLGHWLSAESLPNRLRWAGSPAVALVEKLDDESELTFVDDDHWFHKARQGDALFVRRGARAERFLAYDAELNLPTPIRLQGGPDKFTIVNVSGATLYDVLVSRATPEGRRVAWLDVLPKAESARPAGAGASARPAKAPAKAAADLFDAPQAAKPANPAGPAQGLFGVPAQPAAPAAPKEAPIASPAADKQAKAPGGLFGVAVKGAASPAPKDAAAKPKAGLFGVAIKPDAPAAKDKPAQDAPATAHAEPASKASGDRPAAPLPGGVEVTLSEPLAAGSELATEKTTKALAERLARTGLSANEVEIFVSQFAPLLFEGDAMVVVCRLDPGTLDEKMPLSIFPEPTKVLRVPFVVVRNVDPQIGGEVERLIAQLGDPAFEAREAAQKRLLQLGPLAYEPLKKAINHADMEIVIRAERILLNQNQPAVGRQGAANEAPAKPAAAPAAGAAIVNGIFKALKK